MEEEENKKEGKEKEEELIRSVNSKLLFLVVYSINPPSNMKYFSYEASYRMIDVYSIACMVQVKKLLVLI